MRAGLAAATLAASLIVVEPGVLGQAAPGPSSQPAASQAPAGRGRGLTVAPKADDPANAGADLSPKPALAALSPAEQAKRTWLPAGYRLEPVLADPDIDNPGQIAFDGNGRMFVLELRGYEQTREGQDILHPVGRISVHEDRDNDGIYEHHRVFVDNLLFPRYVLPFGANSILALENDGDEIWRFTDTNDDGVADQKAVFATNAGRGGALGGQPSGLVWALDNWLYSTVNAFRLRWTPTGVLREPTGANGAQWGATQDDDGKMWFQAGVSGLPAYFQFPIHYGTFNWPDQRGAGWILRGVIHLLIYRVVYMNFAMVPESVETPAQFLAYIVFNFALYFRISGLFHLIVGFLLLFGFNLHETHSRFYFSNSFIDFWRRINIYWKDFVQKMFFNPAFVRLKKMGASHIAGVLGAIAVTFLATWALHSYQWFWLRGSVLLTWPDALFWALLGVFLMVQTYLEDRRQGVAARPGLLGPRPFLVLRTVCTFLTICLLWSFWSSETVAAWIELLAASGVAPALSGGEASAADWARTLLSVALIAFMVAVTTGVTFGLGPHAAEAARRGPKRKPAFALAAASTLAPALLLLGAHAGPLRDRLSVDAQLFLEDMSRNRLNARDQALMARGYYEDLTNTQRFNSPLWEVFTFRPNNFQDIEDVAGFRRRADYLGLEYQPGATFTWHDVRYSINRWGMRDDDVDLAKPAGVVRIAVVEASRASGLGVEQTQTFVAGLEQRLNAAAPPGHGYQTLNLSVESYTPIQRLIALEQRALQFSPDLVLYIGGIRDTPEQHIAAMYRRGVPAPYPFIDEFIARAGLDRAMSQARMQERLAPYRWEILGEVYRRFAAACRAHGATPVWFYLSGLHGAAPEDGAAREMQRRLAAEAGFVILDMPDVFGGRELASLQTAAWDHAHPNPFGHRLVADALYAQLQALQREGAIDIGLDERSAASGR